MRVDCQVDFLHGVLVGAGEYELVDHLRGVGADDVRADDLAVLATADDLDEPVRFPRRPGASVGRTLLFASKNIEQNNATVLRDLITGMKKPPTGTGPAGAVAVRKRAVRRG